MMTKKNKTIIKLRTIRSRFAEIYRSPVQLSVLFVICGSSYSVVLHMN